MKEIKNIDDITLKEGDVVKHYCKNCNTNRLFSIFAIHEDIVGQCAKCRKLYTLKTMKIKNNSKPIVECPYCKSTNTHKISNLSKAVNTGLFGAFGTKRFKEWHCNNCGSEF